MAKNDNLTDFLTDVADAIREKKGTTDKINPQEFSNEIKGIKTSSSMWTGHADVEGLKAIGWTDEDIAYFQEHGVNWMEEDDELYKVSDDNKALYGVLTADNIQEYKDRIVWLPKIDFRGVMWDDHFRACKNMIGMPMIDISKSSSCAKVFFDCYSLTCLPPLDFSSCTWLNSAFYNCFSLQYMPHIYAPNCTNISSAFTYCRRLVEVSMVVKVVPKGSYSSYIFPGCSSLIYINLNSTVTVGTASFSNCCSLKKVDNFICSDELGRNTFEQCNCLNSLNMIGLSSDLYLHDSPLITKDSILTIIAHEAATSAISIILRASAYARWANDPDILAALAAHPLVTLASA